MMNHRLRGAAVLCLSVGVMLGCGSGGDEETRVAAEQASASAAPAQDPTAEAEAPTSEPEAEPTATPEPAPGEDAADADDTGDADDAGDADPEETPATAYSTDGIPLDYEFGLVDVGTYHVETLGTPFSFTAEQRLFVQPNVHGRTVLSAPESRGPGDQGLIFMRVSVLTDPSDPSLVLDEFDRGWPADDFVGWLDMLDQRFVTSNRREAVIGGYDAVGVDFEIGDFACGDFQPCVGIATNFLAIYEGAEPGWTGRLWMVDQGDEDPIMVLIVIDSPSKADWLDTAGQILSTVAFGPIEANPLIVYPAGSADLPILGGVRVELIEPTLLLHERRGFTRIPYDRVFGDTEYFANPLGSDGEPLASTDELIDFLNNNSVATTELDPTVIGGFEARVVDLESRGQGAELMLIPAAPAGWFSSPIGRLWIIEHPDRGILVATGWGAGPDQDIINARSIEFAERLLGSLEFIDLG
ncbi:MAG: hypothetical protein AAF567_20235 [Actinomycetota bacterium]